VYEDQLENLVESVRHACASSAMVLQSLHLPEAPVVRSVYSIHLRFSFSGRSLSTFALTLKAFLFQLL
jgi:hypothetical protein